MSWIYVDSQTHALTIFGIRLVGANWQNLQKLGLSVGLLAVLIIASKLLRMLMTALFHGRGREMRVRFWFAQAVHLVVAVIGVVGILSIWFNDPGRLATFMGLVTAGLAFALQRVVTAFAGYALILRGKTFNVGDRITMGGVRGDVMALGFLQTTIMEMGQPPAVQNADPAMWVKARQYTGRVVSVTNDKIFDEPVFNYTREFPYIWEEMTIPVGYKSDWQKAEQILLEAARRETEGIEGIAEEDLRELERRYAARRANMKPRVFLRMTDNWVELTVRFIVKDHAIRDVKDAMGRDILKAFTKEGIEVASGTYDIVGLPEVKVKMEGGAGSVGGREVREDGEGKVGSGRA
ncbi:MAG: mechanosensitive ion channel family protein, partial [Phycisphaerae bacterium]